jgi:1-pyrroline-5-carboxylate dehydrogenase
MHLIYIYSQEAKALTNGIFNVRTPFNEPIQGYAPGSEAKSALKNEIKRLKDTVLEIPLLIGGKEIKTNNIREIRIPHNHSHILAKYYIAGEKELEMAIEAAQRAKETWLQLDWHDRAAIFLKAAELISGPWRGTINAATMLGQSKNVREAEIDAACELIDFLRYNAYYMAEIYNDQPNSTQFEWNRIEYRPLEGFVLAVTPFNFTSIGGNLPITPAMVGNTVIWKPSNNAVYSNYIVMKVLEEAGLPAGVINFVPSRGIDVDRVLIQHQDFAGVHFTGSSAVFESIWATIGSNIGKYKSLPRIVGETGGKDFIFAHNSCDLDALATAIIRGSFEFQGQKCSAASRAYVPKSIWEDLKDKLIADLKTIKVGDIENFTNYLGAVIDQRAFDKIKGYIDYAKNSADAEIFWGGTYDDAKGFFIDPTIILTKDPKFRTMEEEIFGPVMTIYLYEDSQLEETLRLCDQTSPYGLTGSIFARDREVLKKMDKALYFAAGNFYINDKPTGAVVGQQPFGGARKSGTNDKAGSKLNLLRWMSVRNTKETFVPAKDYRYDFLKEK